MVNSLGRFVTVKVPPLDEDGSTHIATFLHKLITSVLTRIRDAKRNNSERPIILMGWGVGAAINCQVGLYFIRCHVSSCHMCIYLIHRWLQWNRYLRAFA